MELLLLEKKCSDFWTKRLRFENWVDIYIKADKYTLTELKSRIFQLICESFERVPAGDLARVDQISFRDVLKYEKIQVPEQFLFARLQRWIAHDPIERVKFVVEFIKYIRLEHLPGQVTFSLSRSDDKSRSICCFSLVMQFLSETVEQFYREHGCMDLIVKEYRKRVQCTGTTCLRRYPTLRNIYCAYCETSRKDNNVIIENFDPTTNKLERINHTLFKTSIKHFGLVMHKERIFIIGGTQDPGYRRDVRVNLFLLEICGIRSLKPIISISPTDGIIRFTGLADQLLFARNEGVARMFQKN